ncbi:MAG: hypothetical protein EBU84_07505 [Actinobacteria bacterium]|nr:hypothetical protein [Actinomycetota bacterium]
MKFTTRTLMNKWFYGKCLEALADDLDNKRLSGKALVDGDSYMSVPTEAEIQYWVAARTEAIQYIDFAICGLNKNKRATMISSMMHDIKCAQE